MKTKTRKAKNPEAMAAWNLAQGKLDYNFDKVCPFSDDARFEDFIPVAERMMDDLGGERDGKYLHPQTNRIALINRLIGYIMAQPWYVAYEEWSEAMGYKDDVSLLAWDLATQLEEEAINIAIQDVNPVFMDFIPRGAQCNGPDAVALTAKIEAAKRNISGLDIAKGKQRLGYQPRRK